MRRFYLIIFFVSNCYAQNTYQLDPLLQLLDPIYDENPTDPNCEFLNRPHEETMCDRHIIRYFELLTNVNKSIGGLLNPFSETIWALKSKNRNRNKVRT